MNDFEKTNINQEEVGQSEAERVLGSMPSFEEHMAEIDKESPGNGKMEIKSEYHDGNSEEDKQIRAGILTHVRVESGDSFDDAMAKLDYLKSQGKAAFLNFNGQRFDNYTQPDKEEQIDNTIELDNKKQELELLDDNLDVPNEGKYGLVGIIGGVKKATEFTAFIKNGEEESRSKEIDNLIGKLGLEFTKESEPSQFSPDYTEVLYYVSKTKEEVDRVKELVEKSRLEGQTGDATRELGRMFGFPSSAIEYFIKRNKGEIVESADSNRRGSLYIHSPDNGEAEYKQYEEKINKIFSKYCPLSAEELLAQR